MEIVLAKEMKRITEDMQIREVKVNNSYGISDVKFFSFSHFQY
jgi:hypothetical protein